MCLSTPKISTPDTPTPAPLPPDIDKVKQVESVKYGDADTNTETASGRKGKRAKGKSSLQIKKPTEPKSTGVNTGA